MKKLLFYFVALITAGVSFTSCDHVDNPFPVGYNTDLDTNLYPGLWSDYLANEWPDFAALPNDDPNTNVIIEDFTGHYCSNCPAAAIQAHNVHESNPNRVFVASVHAGPTANGITNFQEVNIPAGYTVDFMNPQGLAYGGYFGTTLSNSGFFGNPAGTVNRRLEGTEYFYASGFWSTKANEVLALPLRVAIKAKVNYYDATKGLFLHTEVEKIDQGINDEDLAIVTYLIEDSLVAPQLDANSTPSYIPDYVHRDIMRGTLSGNPWGRDVVSGDLVNGKYQLNYSYVVPDQLAPQGQATTYNAENMHLLIYVYDKNTYEILQVIKKKLHRNQGLI